MKIASILTVTAAFTTTALAGVITTNAGDQSWRMMLYAKMGYVNQFEDLTSVGRRSCVDLRRDMNDKTKSFHWVSPNCQLTVYKDVACRGKLSNFGFGSQHVPHTGMVYGGISSYSIVCR